MNVTRLFDYLQYSIDSYDEIPMLTSKVNGEWKTYTNRDVKAIVDQLSCGLLELGLSGHDLSEQQADKVGILSANRPEWIFLDLACQQAGILLCPIYPTTNPRELEYIFNDAGIKAVFCGSDDLFEKVIAVSEHAQTVQHVFTFDEVEGATHWSTLLHDDHAKHLPELESVRDRISGSNVATIIYTSGTTGFPKGVMLTHHNVVSNVENSVKSFPFEPNPGGKILSFLPLNHIFERMVSYIYIRSGNHICYAESLETIGENLKEINPVGFCTVPRLLEKVFEKIMDKGRELTGIKRNLFDWSIDLGFKYDNLKSGGPIYNAKLALANKLVFSKWREALGGNLEFIITGSAACQPRLLRVFNAAKIPIYEGYGPTENSPVISVNRSTPGGMKFGTVGPAVDGQEVKLAEDGEILVKGPSVMKGYFNQPELTAQTVIDGWLYTGDIGVWEEFNGVKFLKITDRKKELFKTSGGKYVAPQPIENKLKESPFIEQVMVVGAERKFVGALVVPSFPTLTEWMRKENIPVTTLKEAIKHPKVKEHYQRLVQSFNEFFNQVEQIKKFELLPREWTIDTGELTPTLKVKRKVITEKYQEQINNIYGGPAYM